MRPFCVRFIGQLIQKAVTVQTRSKGVKTRIRGRGYLQTLAAPAVLCALAELHADDAVHGGEHRRDPAPPGRDPPHGEHRVHDGRRSAGLLQVR